MMEGGIKKMLENKVKKFNNLEGRLSYNVLAGKSPDEIIKFSEELGIDLIVKASSRISSTIRVIEVWLERSLIALENQP